MPVGSNIDEMTPKGNWYWLTKGTYRRG